MKVRALSEQRDYFFESLFANLRRGDEPIYAMINAANDLKAVFFTEETTAAGQAQMVADKKADVAAYYKDRAATGTGEDYPGQVKTPPAELPVESEHEFQMKAKNIVSIYQTCESLREALRQAHAGDGVFGMIMDMSVAEFISNITGPNHIHFVYNGKTNGR